MKNVETLIHCALLAEAKPIIGHFKLKKLQQNTYVNKDILLVVSGMGLENTKQVLGAILQEYSFKKAINIGIAGCIDKNLSIGSLFCTNKKLEDIPFETLTSFEKPVTCKEDVKSTLVDMEAEAFLHVSSLHVKDIYVFKVVSDYLSDKIPTKAFVNSLIQKNIKRIEKYVKI